ncbi:glycosyltransferase family 2 protein [Spirosoma foliorum]|nr:glycosyltransferase family 2 protein [Spirosoma foliorum]
MATYNGELYIERQLKSILQQLDINDEIIISDDGSTDKTLQIIDGFADRRIKVFVNKKRRGPVGNFENALLNSCGQYIYLADQDDIWLPDKISTINSLLKNHDLVLADCEVVDQNGNLLQASFFEHRGSSPGFWNNLYRNSYMGCCMAFRREILDYVLPFPSKIHMHDWWIGLLVEAKGRVIFYEEPLIKYVRHGGNASPTGEVGYGFYRKFSNRLFLLVYLIKHLLLH